MLLLLFETSEGRYALESQHVVEVIPLLQPKKIPGAPLFIAGIINYRGQAVPVIDLCALAGASPCREYYSTRIILVRYPLAEGQERLIGLIAERATDVVTCNASDIRASGILLEKNQGAGADASGEEEIVQMFNVARMIPADIVRELF
ncbi:MAG: chemotaxis protein [Desulfobulbus sp.]|nr:MAG: chemotaxis protein [Desulfobulbus sp.]